MYLSAWQILSLGLFGMIYVGFLDDLILFFYDFYFIDSYLAFLIALT